MYLKPLTWKLADFVGKTADKVHTSYFDFLLYTVTILLFQERESSGHGEGKF